MTAGDQVILQLLAASIPRFGNFAEVCLDWAGVCGQERWERHSSEVVNPSAATSFDPATFFFFFLLRDSSRRLNETC